MEGSTNCKRERERESKNECKRNGYSVKKRGEERRDEDESEEREAAKKEEKERVGR